MMNPGRVLVSDAWCKLHGFDRQYVHQWWFENVPEALALSDPMGLDPQDDSNFWNMILDIQRFVFSDLGYQPSDEVNGELGPMTISRMEAFTDSNTECPGGECLADAFDLTPSDHIIFDGEKLPVEGVSVVSFEEPDGLDLLREMRERYGKVRGCRKWPGDIDELIKHSRRYATMLGCLHWDAGWSATGAFNTLVKRALATCVGVDRPRKSDQQVIAYQWMDPGKRYGFHGGAFNKKAVVSFDLSNAVYLKYAAKYEKLCGIPRPVVRLPFRKKRGHLGMYADQILTTLRILKAVADRTKLPLVFPCDKKGRPINGNYPRIFNEFNGVATHENLPDTSKWDIRCFQQQTIVLMLVRPVLQSEFPTLRELYRLDDPWCQKLWDYVQEHWEWAELGIGV
jgi:hypothetical protein